MCHFKAMSTFSSLPRRNPSDISEVFLYRPSLRRLIARLRSQSIESIRFDDADRKTISMTYKACQAITMTSLCWTRTVSSPHVLACRRY